jgi:TPR repeat protein
MNNMGFYHRSITGNYEEMEKYYLMAIEHGNTKAMNNMGLYHKNITKNYEEMKKYYLMAIEHGNSTAMNNMGYYHKNITKNYEEMKKYYLMAIEHGNPMAMNNMGWYHYQITKDYIEMKKYYKMAIEHGDLKAMTNIKNFFSNNCRLFVFLNTINPKHSIIKEELDKLEYKEKTEEFKDELLACVMHPDRMYPGRELELGFDPRENKFSPARIFPVDRLIEEKQQANINNLFKLEKDISQLYIKYVQQINKLNK